MERSRSILKETDAGRRAASAGRVNGTESPLHPLLQLQQSLGNRAVQRLIGADFREGYDPASSAMVNEVLGSGGEALDRDLRDAMESRFGADFSGVRVHTDGRAAESARGVAAHAYTSGQDIVFAEGRYAPETPEGQRLVAHELTHVVQQAAGPVAGTPTPDGALSISDPEDSFEQAADAHAGNLIDSASLRGEGDVDAREGVAIQRDDDDSWLGGLGDMISSAGSAVASGVGSVVNAGESLASDAVSAVSSGVSSAIDTGSSLVSDVGSAISSGASAAWDTGSKVAGEVGSAISSGAEAVGGVASDVESFAEHLPGPLGMPNPLRVAHGLYDVAANGADLGDTLNRTMNPLNYMREDAASVKSAEGYLNKGIDWLEDEGKGATHWLANQVSDVPVIGDIASFGESMVDTGIDVAGGVGKGITGLAGGLAGMAADPIDAAKGLYTMSEHLPVVGLPAKILSGAYDLATTDKSFGDVANEALNPMEDLKYWGKVGGAVLSPLEQSIAAGKPGEAFGQAGVLAASFLGGEGEIGAAGEIGEEAEGLRAAELGAPEVADPFAGLTEEELDAAVNAEGKSGPMVQAPVEGLTTKTKPYGNGGRYNEYTFKSQTSVPGASGNVKTTMKVHDADLTAPPGGNSAEGQTLGIEQGKGNRRLLPDPDAPGGYRWIDKGTATPDEWNQSHIPLFPD